jgi:DNA-binding response OmpR family regulator
MKKILMIEDDPIISAIYSKKLAAEGFNVELAQDAVSGQSKVASFLPDLVILDLMLPRVSGVEVIKQLRARPEFKQLPILVFSNSYLANVVQEAWKAGASRCLSKAECNPNLLISVIKKLLSTTGVAEEGTPESLPSLFAPVSPAPRNEAVESTRVEFTREAETAVAALRSNFKSLARPGSPEAQAGLHEMYSQVRSLTSRAAFAGHKTFSQLASAFEALLKELSEKPDSINASTLRTLAHAIDFIAQLVPKAAAADALNLSPPAILVVDDEPISRRAVVYALEKAGLKSTSLNEPHAALDHLSQNRLELVLLDVDMPGMSGFDLCQKLRALPAHAKTPVIFVTAMTDFESRAKSTLSGGNDLIGKPFLFMELAVKALVYILKARLETARP